LIPKNFRIKEHLFPIVGMVFSSIGLFLLAAAMDDKPGPPQKKFSMPEGFNPQVLEDRESPRAKLFMTSCTQCHGLPDPKAYMKEEWPPIVLRMVGRMQRTRAFSTRSVTVPNDEELNEIISYVRAYAKNSDTAKPPLK
jgi:hypothetical protein